jgi:hypothetical protein
MKRHPASGHKLGKTSLAWKPFSRPERSRPPLDGQLDLFGELRRPDDDPQLDVFEELPPIPELLPRPGGAE